MKAKEAGESKKKQVFKTRHFPHYKIKCRLALRGTGVTLSIWAIDRAGRWAATKTLGIQSLLALSPARRENGLGLSLSDRALQTLSECVIKGWVTEVGDPQGWGLTALGHRSDLEDQLGCSDYCLDQGFPAHQPAHTHMCFAYVHITYSYASLVSHTSHVSQSMGGVNNPCLPLPLAKAL